MEPIRLPANPRAHSLPLRLGARLRTCQNRLLAVVLGTFALCTPALADNATVGNGTPASCTEAAFDAAITQLVVGVQGPGGVLTFNCGAAMHTINLTTEKSVEGQCTINGGGRITLSGQNLTRHFNIFRTNPEDQTAVTLTDITLTNGRADYGGAVYVGEGTRLDTLRVSVFNSQADFTGGAIAAAGNSLLNVSSSNFTFNAAQAGGAIVSYSVANVADSAFDFNSSISVNGSSIPADGGAIASFLGNLDVQRSTFTGNSADSDGGAIYKKDAELAVDNSRFDANTSSSGGAIFLESLADSASIQNSQFETNEAEFFGGAIQAYDAIEVYRSVFQDNQASGGGAISASAADAIEIADSTFIGNLASSFGGAIVASNLSGSAPPVNLYISQTTTSANSAGNEGGDLYFLDSLPVNASVSYSTLMNASSANGSTLRIGTGSTLSVAASMIWATSGVACSVQPGGLLLTADYNLAPSSCGFGGPHDQFLSSFSAFGLTPITDNGGKVPTFLPQVSSPATDRIAGCLFKGGDARGLVRPVDSNGNGTAECDIGAVERQVVEIVDDRIFANDFEAF